VNTRNLDDDFTRRCSREPPRTFGRHALAGLGVKVAAILASDFCTVDLPGGTQAYVLAVMEHANRRIRVLGVTPHPTGEQTTQQARNLIMELGDQADRVKF
jgi:1-aminocyclopropane-1-carboxylate deaminase/D-cysteine desulfhydrase-like pyridoxal-dependent ACC family enzyme